MRRNLILGLLLTAVSIWLVNWTRGGNSWIAGIADHGTVGLRRAIWGDRGDGTDADKLRAEIAGLQYTIAELGRLEAENVFLREQLKINAAPDREKIKANVVGGGHGVIRIDQGETAGVKTGASVTVGNVLAGRVISANDWGASVALPISVDFKLEVDVVGGVSGAKRASGIATGGEGKIKLTKVLRDENIAPGDILVSAGSQGESVGLVVGTISEVLEAGGVYQEAIVEPGVDLGRITQVLILK